MTIGESGQVSRSAAEIYDEFFLPALFQQWVERVVDVARIQKGQSVLDVACGTGVLARAAAQRSGPGGRVVGLDLNDGMLAVARKKAPEVEWRSGAAEALPFQDAEFEVVVSQFGLMFFSDRKGALREMLRVLRPGGGLAIAVWDALDHSPGYARIADLLKRLFGDDIADALRAPFVLGDPQVLQRLLSQAGAQEIEVEVLPGKARFPSLQSWMYTEIKGWTLADALTEEQFQLLQQEAAIALQPYEQPDGSVQFDNPALIAKARRS